MDQQDNKIYKLTLYAAESMIKSGSETYRAEETIKRMLASRGIEQISTFVSPTVIIIGDNKRDGMCFIQNINKRSSNLARIELLNDLSRAYVNHDIDTDEALEKLKEINTFSPYPYWLMIFGGALGCAIFSILIGGNMSDFIATLIASSISFHANEKITEISNTQFLGFFMSSLLVTLIAIGLNKMGLGQNLESTIVGSVLPLVPGVAITTGVRDFMSGDLLSGMARVMEAVTIAVAIAFGVGFTLTFFTFFGGLL